MTSGSRRLQLKVAPSWMARGKEDKEEEQKGEEEEEGKGERGDKEEVEGTVACS